MRALRVVGLTEDGEVVLEDPVRLERFRVPADERLRAAARGDLSRLGQIAIELESQLRPREIQARIRAGASVEQVAAAAGVPEQKIERFAYPVLLERFRTAEIAQRAHPVRAEGPDNRTLAEVVGHTFGLRGQAYEGALWDSWKGEDGRWVVALGWRAGRSDNRAHWTFQPGAHGGTVTALDEHASDLVEGLPARPLRTVGAVVDMHPEEGPPPAPAPVESPVEQWRAAASDSYRERMPHAPEPRSAPDRAPTRPAPEPWRPGPPAQRQGEREPVETRVSERSGGYRGAEPRPAVERESVDRPTADRTSADRSVEVERTAQAVPTARTAPPSDPTATPAAAAPAPAAPAPAAPAPAAPAPAAPAPAAPIVATPAAAAAPAAPAAAAPATPAPDPSPATEPDTASADPASAGATEPVGTAPVTASPAAEIPAAGPPADAAAEPRTDEKAAVETTAVEMPADPTPVETPPVETPAADTPTDTPAGTPAADTPATRRTRKGKPVMPSWDEVLLGVRGPR